VSHHPNIDLVLSGHVTNGGAARLTSTGLAGNRVHEILSNYQEYPRGGDGWLRIMQIEPASRRVRVFTYSPTRDVYWLSDEQHFELELDKQ